MKELFFNMLNVSFYGSIVILAVLILRLVLKKAPRAAICLLWLLAGIRLMLPFTIESRLSLQPDVAEFDQPQQTQISGVQAGTPDMLETPALPQAGQVPAMPNPSELPEDVQIFVSNDAVSDVTVTEKPERVVDYGALAAWVWAAGILGLLAYSGWSYWRLRRRVREAVRQADGSWVCPGLDTAFVLGLIRPRIYLPSGLSDRDRELILAHERSHIARKDHWIKPIGYLILMLHWFNPLVWLAYVCLCRDIEMACDERVVKTMDVAARKEYSLALLNCGSRGIGIAACPVAFGEVGVKQRILGVLHYRKPGFWIVVAAVVAVVFVAVCLMTSPAGQDDSLLNAENAAGMLENRKVVIAVEYKQNINGEISVMRADGGQVAQVLKTANWGSWLVSRSHDGFTAYVDMEILDGLSLRVFDNGHADMIRGDEIRHFRVSKKLYEQLHGLFVPATGDDAEAAAAEMGSAVWNLNMTLDSISPTGLRLTFRQSGRFPGSAIGSLRFGAAFGLERFNGESWVPAEKLDGNELTAWDTVAYEMPMDGTMSHDVDWSWLYGELAPGHYRIGKRVSLDIPNQQSLNADFYAEFYLSGAEDAFSGVPGNAWGLTLEARDITPTGMTLVCAHKGEASRIMTGEAFELYARMGQGWVPVPMVTRDATWKDIAWEVNQNGQTQWTLDWQWLYGELPQGEYLLVKEFYGDGDELELRLRFTVGETAAVQWEELPALELCRRALEEFQSRESGYVTWENSFSTSGTAQSRVSGEYWFVGENWLRRIDPNSASSVYRPSYLGIGNRVYRGSGDEVEEWFAVGDQGAAGLRLWIYGLTWDEQKISLLSDKWQDDERQITLEVQGTPPSVVDGSVTQYQVTFRFDREGNFLGTSHAYLEPGGEVETMVVSTMDIRESAGKTPEQVLAEAREPLLRQEQQDLEQCLAALERFQKQDSYHVVQQDFYGGSILDSSAVTNYWKSGDDWLHIVAKDGVNNGTRVYQLKKGGVEYKQELYDTLTDNPQGWFWSVAEESSDCMSGNWLAVFNWENSMVEHVVTDATGDDGRRVRMTVEEDSSAFGEYCPYEVRFWFESDGSLQSVELILEENKGKENWYIINSIYNIDHIENADAQINAAYEECLAAEMEKERLRCMDTSCQDASHDHSARDCTDSDCTIPDHHHDHGHH